MTTERKKAAAKTMDAKVLLETFLSSDRNFDPLNADKSETHEILLNEITKRLEAYDKISDAVEIAGRS